MSYNPFSQAQSPLFALPKPYPIAPSVTFASSGGDDTAAFQAFVDKLASNASGIRTGVLIDPIYKVTSLDLSGHDGVRLFGGGTNGAVTILGTTASGGDSIINLADPTIYTRDFGLTNIAVNTQTAGAYDYGIKYQNIVECDFDNLRISGDFAINAEHIETAYLNRWSGGTAWNTGSQKITTQFGTNNINANVFTNRRYFSTVGAGAAQSLNLGVSRGNVFVGCDIGTADIAIDCAAVFGVTFQNCYSEGADIVVKIGSTGIARGVSWVGGYMNPNVGGTCFKQGANDVYGLFVQQATFQANDSNASTVFDITSACYDAFLYPNTFGSNPWLSVYPANRTPVYGNIQPGIATYAGIMGPIGTDSTGRIAIIGSTPSSATANGNKGTVTWDANYIYVCTALNTWKRIAIATW